MKTPILPALVLLSVVSSVLANDVQPYRQKNRSQFEPGASPHDPFWPVGYVHKEVYVAQSEQRPAVELKASQFDVSSISVFGRERLAVINQKVFGVGDVIPLPIGGQKVGVQVVAIQDGNVVLQYETQRVRVSLRNPSLAKLAPAGVTETPSQGGNPPAPALQGP